MDIERVRELANPLIEKVIPEKKNKIEFRKKLHEDELPYRAINKLKNGKFFVDFNPNYWTDYDSKKQLKKLKRADKVLQCTILHELCHIKLGHIKGGKDPTEDWEKQLCAIDNELCEIEVDIEAKKVAKELRITFFYKKRDLINHFRGCLNLLPELIRLIIETDDKTQRENKTSEIDKLITRIVDVYNKIIE